MGAIIDELEEDEQSHVPLQIGTTSFRNGDASDVFLDADDAANQSEVESPDISRGAHAHPTPEYTPGSFPERAPQEHINVDTVAGSFGEMDAPDTAENTDYPVLPKIQTQYSEHHPTSEPIETLLESTYYPELPEITLDEEPEQGVRPGFEYELRRSSNDALRRNEISADISTANMVEGKRQRRPPRRAYTFATFEDAHFDRKTRDSYPSVSERKTDLSQEHLVH